MAPQTPYTADLGERDPIVAMSESSIRCRALLDGWSPAQFERSYAPGKWSARLILIHLAQSEIALGNRGRMALATPNYSSQAFDQDVWMAQESSISGREALDALLGLNAMNRGFFGALSAADRATAFTHPEYGALTIDWLLHQMAGHLVHHLKQLEAIATL
jgi:DinB family protein